MADIRTNPDYALPRPAQEVEELKGLVEQLKQVIREFIRDVHDDLQNHETRITDLE